MPDEANQIWSLVILIILLCIIGASVAIVLILNQKKFHFNKTLLKVESDFQESMLLTKLEIQEQTFNHIAREIHDHIGQRLSMARLQINQFENVIPNNNHEKFIEASKMIEEAIADLKMLSRSITADIIKEEGLLTALQIEINRVKKIVPIDINLEIRKEQDPPFMPEENELIIYRIIQEAIQNILKHAQAGSVHIQLIYDNNHLHMIIKDDGVGFDPAAFTKENDFTKSGLANLKKRADLLMGNFEIRSSPGNGTTLIFELPHNTTTLYATKQ